jgi:hypothetical protein
MAADELSDAELGKAVREILRSTRNEQSQNAAIQKMVLDRPTSAQIEAMNVASAAERSAATAPKPEPVSDAPDPVVVKKKTASKRSP